MEKSEKKIPLVKYMICAFVLGIILFIIYQQWSIATIRFSMLSLDYSQSGIIVEPRFTTFTHARWYDDGKASYLYEDGDLVTGWKEVDGKTYYFDKSGKLVCNTMVEKNRYVNQNGQLVDAKDIYKYGVEGLSNLKQILQKQVDGYYGTVSIYVKNLDTNEYLLINDEEIFSASLIKLYTAAAVCDEVEKGHLEQSATISNYLHDMITASDNGAYNHLLSILGNGNIRDGMDIVTDLCKKNGYANTGCGCTLSSSETGFPEIWKFTNYTSAKDCGHYLEDVYRGNLVSEESSGNILDLLKHQEWRMKIPSGLPEGVVCANKTGEYENRQHDSAIVFSKGADYVLVVMTDHDGAAIGHIQDISRSVYEYFNK